MPLGKRIIMYIGKLCFEPVIEHEEMVPEVIFQTVKNWSGKVKKESFLVAEIDPIFAGGKELCEHYDIDIKIGANCLVVEGKRNKQSSYAVCLVPVGYKYNMSSVIRKAMNMRQVSVAPLQMVLDTVQMEYGSITPIGLPIDWPLYIDPLVMKNERIIIGGGFVKCKLSILTQALLDMPNSVVLDGVAKAPLEE